jgi:hypothetical protein
MKFKILEHPYAVTNIVFVLIGLFGGWYQRWDGTTLAFVLGLYLVVIIGIRLDDIQQQVTDRRQLPVDPQLLEKMENMEVRLAEISEKLDRALKQPHS